jgi:hypothetical protein
MTMLMTGMVPLAMTLISSDLHGLHKGAIPVALGLREEIVVPLSVRMGLQIGNFSGLANDANFRTLPRGQIDGVEGIRFRVDPPDGRFAGDLPLVRDVPDMGDVLVRAKATRLRDAGDLIFAHGGGG